MTKAMHVMIGIVLVAICGIGVYLYAHQRNTQPFFYIVCPTYNNEKWCIKNIEAVVQQLYPHWKMVIVNDCSTDKTSELLREYINTHNLSDKILLVDNKKRCKACRNIYDAIHGSQDADVHLLPPCPDQAIVVLYDGDDWLAHTEVLTRLAREYSDPKVWLTHGTYKTWPEQIASCCAPIPDHIMRARLFRSYPYCTSHLRTFKAWLFKKIKKADLMYAGDFYPTTWDLAMMFPMLEMASQGHIEHIRDTMYIYNVATPLNDYKVHFELQQRLAHHIRALPRYLPVEE